MKIRDWFILIVTFLVGAFCGVYLYVTSFKPNYEPDDLPDTRVGELSIIGIEYASLSDSPASFRVKDDGTYDYIRRNSLDEEKIEGELPKALFNQLVNEIAAADLETLSEAGAGVDTNVVCAADNLPTNYEYNILYKEQEYTLDTCVGNFSNDHPLGETFLEVWEYMADPENFTISVSNSPDTSAPPDRSVWTLKGFFERGFEEAGFQGN